MSKLAYPKGRLLLVRDCTVDICLKNNPGAVLLSVLLFWYDNPHKGDWENQGLHEFCMCRTQAEIEEASCHQIDVKTIHDTAIPLLYLLGYLHVGKKMHGDLYILHMDRILAAFAAYEQSEKAKDPTHLKNFLRSQLESAPIEIPEDQLERTLINKSRLYFEIARTLIRIREDSNCKRGPKLRPQQAAEAISENIEIIRDSIEIDTKRDSGAFAPSDFLPPEEEISEEDEPPPTVKMPAIKLNGASHAPVVNTLPADRGSASVVSRSGVSGSHDLQRPGRPERYAKVPVDPQGGRQATTALQVQPQTQEITQQTPGPGALPPSAEPPQFGGSPGITSDQAIPSLLLFVDPEPAQSDSNPPAATGPAQASGEPKETAKQKKARLEHRRDEIIALHCQLLGRNVVRSKDELEGARLMAEAGSTDAEITITYNRYKKDKFWGHQLTLKNVAKLLDTTVANDTSVPVPAKPRARPTLEEVDVSIFEVDKQFRVYQRRGEDQEWILWQGEFCTPEEADERGYNGGFGLYNVTQYDPLVRGVN